MRILRRDLVQNGPGSVEMVPIDADDLWRASNLIAPGNSVTAVTVRKVPKETAPGARRKRDVERVRLELEIKVEQVVYEKAGSVLRISGKNMRGNEHVKAGEYHTLELELQRPFVLRKAVWGSSALDMLRPGPAPENKAADLAVVLVQEGRTQILLVGGSTTTTCASVETPISRKQGRGAGAVIGGGYQAALNDFFENVVQAFLKHVDFKAVRCAVIASPGSEKDQVHRRLLLEAERRQLRQITANKSRILLVHTSPGHKNSLKEVLDAPTVRNMMKGAEATGEVRALKDFFDKLRTDPDRACYGPEDVAVAHESFAIQTLLITDDLFRSPDIGTRKKYSNLVDAVKRSGGSVHIISSKHASGEQLAQLTGIAATLRFPLPDLEI